MSLRSRIEAFDELSRRFPCERPSKLISAYRIEEKAPRRLRVAAMLYMSKCLPGQPVILDEEKLLFELVKHQEEIKNITPNGMIVPKRYTILEYNILARTFVEIVNELNVSDFILSWHVPLNLRIKFASVSEENMKRHHPTEHIHSDSWAGESSESVTTHLPLFGNTARNRVVFYDPPPEFQEDWLKPRPSYADGATIAQKYSRIDFIPEKGCLVLADFATLHASSRFPKAGSRVSIDTTFALKRIGSHREEEKIHPWRENERAPHQVLMRLGETHLFLFPDDTTQQVDSQGGFKHPTNLKLTKLL